MAAIRAEGAQAAAGEAICVHPKLASATGRPKISRLPAASSRMLPVSIAPYRSCRSTDGAWRDWTVGGEFAKLDGTSGNITYRFHARDLHLVLGASTQGRPLRFRVRIDGAPPGVDHGFDVDAEGWGACGKSGSISWSGRPDRWRSVPSRSNSSIQVSAPMPSRSDRSWRSPLPALPASERRYALFHVFEPPGESAIMPKRLTSN
jgi:hypothetical protein